VTTHDDLAIDAQGLTRSFGDLRAVDGVDLTVTRGSVMGLLGPNGAGKSTVIRILATLIQPDAGVVRILGHDLVADADAVRGHIALTGQFAAVDQDLTGRENLTFIARLTGYARRGARPGRRAIGGIRPR
jgi:ABC-2 type transport system ATP-binding protein